MFIKVIACFILVANGVYGFTNCHKSRWANEDITRYNNEHIEKYSLFPDVPRSDVLFRLWTRAHKNVYSPLYVGQLESEDTIRPEQPFKFIIHGWTDCADSDWYEIFKDEYLIKGDYNIILVDWAKPASALYPLSATYTTDVGKYVGELIVDLYKTYNIPLTNVHLIGHSLGAHISGYAGKYVEEQTGNKIGRITALDPAGPLFLLSGCKKRLCKTDAEFIDVIHTDGGKLGYNGVLGHVDFYPNGGTAPQKGCVLFGVVDAASCSHTRSYWLMAESINSEQFISNQCASYRKFKNGECKENSIALMGENASPNVEGVYYLNTNGATLFARNGEI